MTCALRVLVFALLQSSAPVYASTPGDCKTGACASQIDDATAMIQSKAKVSLALQTSEDDPMLLMKSSGAERLAASQKMESSMENAVTKMLNGNYVVPAPEYFELIEAQLELMLGHLVAEKGGFQTQMDGANANVAKCNTNMNNASEGSVAEAKAIADAFKTTHHACRVAEKAAYESKNSFCAAMDNKTEDVSAAAPQCNCLLSNSSDTTVVLDCLANNRNWVQSSESDLESKKEDCDTKTDLWSSKADVCDKNQSSYEVATCTYARKLENMRSTHDTCYSTADSARTSTKELVELEEKHLKAVLASVKKILCFMSILKKANMTSVNMTDFENCKNMNVYTDKNYSDNSVNDMDISYSPADPKSTDTHEWDLSVMPGDGQWEADEYAAYTTEWLRETVVCPHMTTTTTTQAPTTVAPTTASPTTAAPTTTAATIAGYTLVHTGGNGDNQRWDIKSQGAVGQQEIVSNILSASLCADECNGRAWCNGFLYKSQNTHTTVNQELVEYACTLMETLTAKGSGVLDVMSYTKATTTQATTQEPTTTTEAPLAIPTEAVSCTVGTGGDGDSCPTCSCSGTTCDLWHKKFCHIWTGSITGVQCDQICKADPGCWGYNLPSGASSTSTSSYSWCRLYGTITTTGSSGVSVHGTTPCDGTARVSQPSFSGTTDWVSGNTGNEMCYILPQEAPTTVAPTTTASPTTAAPTTTAANKKYVLIDTSYSWQDAEGKCVDLGGHLASIRSQDENDQAASLCATSTCSGCTGSAGKPYFCWIGGYKPTSDLSSGAFQWTDGTPAAFTNWNSNGGQAVGSTSQIYLALGNPSSTYESGKWEFEESGGYPAICKVPEATTTTQPPTPAPTTTAQAPTYHLVANDQSCAGNKQRQGVTTLLECAASTAQASTIGGSACSTEYFVFDSSSRCFCVTQQPCNFHSYAGDSIYKMGEAQPGEWILASSSSQNCNDVCTSSGKACTSNSEAVMKNAASSASALQTALGSKFSSWCPAGTSTNPTHDVPFQENGNLCEYGRENYDTTCAEVPSQTIFRRICYCEATTATTTQPPTPAPTTTVEDQRYYDTFQRTGCPNTQVLDPKLTELVAWWKTSSDANVLTDMYTYCTLVDGHSASSIQKIRCCGSDTFCTVTCVQQDSLQAR